MITYQPVSFSRTRAHGATKSRNTAPKRAATLLARREVLVILPTDVGRDQRRPLAVLGAVEPREPDLPPRVGALARAKRLPGDEVDRVLDNAGAPRDDGVRVGDLLHAAAAGDAVQLVAHGLDAVVRLDGAGVVVLVVVDTDFLGGDAEISMDNFDVYFFISFYFVGGGGERISQREHLGR